MTGKEFGVDSFTLDELDELMKDEMEQETPPASTTTEPDHQATEETVPEPTAKETGVNETKAFAKRLKESTDKARIEEREALAKEFGFDSYAEMQKNKEAKLYESKGLNPEDVSPIVEQLVEQRIASDPRFKELESYRNQRILEFAKKELQEISELTGGEITQISQIPQAVKERWAEKGSLKSAYLEIEGENLVNKIRSGQSKGSTSHLADLGGATPTPINTRPLTDAEKKVWRTFNPTMTEEELSKVKVDK